MIYPRDQDAISRLGLVLQVDVVLPLKASSQPRTDAAAAVPIGPGLVVPGQAPFSAINLVSAQRREWYEFVFDTGEKRYVPKVSVPEWTPIDENIDLVSQ